MKYISETVVDNDYQSLLILVRFLKKNYLENFRECFKIEFTQVKNNKNFIQSSKLYTQRKYVTEALYKMINIFKVEKFENVCRNNNKIKIHQPKNSDG